MANLTLPQIELIADAASGRCWHHNGRDYATGTHSDRDVTRAATPLTARGLLTEGEHSADGWLWQPTDDGYWAARGALDELAARLGITRKLLDRWKDTDATT